MARSAARRSPNRPPTTATGSSTTTSSGRRTTSSGWSRSTASASSTTGTAPPTRRSSGSAARSSCAHDSQEAISEFRPYFDHAPVYGGGPTLEDYMDQTPLTVGLAAAGHRPNARLPRHRRRLSAPAVPRRPRRTAARRCVLEQIEMLGELVVPVLRREFAIGRPADRPRRARSTRGSRRAGRHGRARRPARGGPAGERHERDTRRSLVVVSGGLSQPSSTRLLADRLQRPRPASPRRRHRAGDRGHRAPRSRPGPHEPPADRLPEPDPAGGDRRRPWRGRPDRRDADLQRVVQRPLQAVLRRPRAGRPGRASRS